MTTTTAIADANAAIRAASEAGAEKSAVFEYTCAVAYLHKAREEEGYSDFQAAIDLANAAAEFARKGAERAGSPLPGKASVPPNDESPTDAPGSRL